MCLFTKKILVVIENSVYVGIIIHESPKVDMRHNIMVYTDKT